MLSVKASYKYLLFLGLVVLSTDCSVEKNTGATRFYQSLTSRYNIYFNGYESFKAGVTKVANNYTDDYAEMLKVFDYSDPSSATACAGDMERAIQKASKVISLKSITAKPEEKDNRKSREKESKIPERKEYNDWVDDSYLLIGKARFYKHEFNEGSAVFDYCITEANDPLIKNEASIWLARTYNETNRYSDSYQLLTELDINNLDSRMLKSMYFTTLADLFIKQKKYPEAIEPLGKAIELASGKRTKYRLTYLLAQLNEQSGNPGKAISLYGEVVKMNPPYDVEFNARINIAGVFDVNSGNPQEMKRELEKMLKDSKNKDFLDQIYFSLGSLSLREGNEREALGFFHKSASSPSSNQNQKGRTYLALADYYFKKSDFLKAGNYYDSTVFFFNQKHPDYQVLNQKTQNLRALTSQLKIIQREDSLQKIAAMPESERNALISSIIGKITQAEAEGKTSQYSDRYNLGQYYENERRFQNNIDQEGKWYFYNQSALTFGRTEFRRRWGDRRLEDNWRRSNKARMAGGPQVGATVDESVKAASDSSNAVLDYKKPEFYLKNLPLNDSSLSASNERIVNAYLNAGKAYAEKLNDAARATQIFDKLIMRYPENELVPEAIYNLYKVNQNINGPLSETYRQRLLEKYPSTEFTRILSDPAYFEKKQAEMKLVEQLYDQAYNSYITENFNVAMSQCDDAMKQFSQDQLAPKFMLLRAYCVARISDERTFKEELNKLIKQWPLSNESKKAGEIISYLNLKIPELKIEEEKVIAQELFVADTVQTRVFVLIIADPAFNINQASFDVISYNIDNYTNKNYRTEGTLVDNKYIMISVSGFTNYAQVLNYYMTFTIDKTVRNTPGAKMYSFVISNDNLKVLNKDKNPERYLLFFNQNYLHEKN